MNAERCETCLHYVAEGCPNISRWPGPAHHCKGVGPISADSGGCIWPHPLPSEGCRLWEPRDPVGGKTMAVADDTLAAMRIVCGADPYLEGNRRLCRFCGKAEGEPHADDCPWLRSQEAGG